jgi:Peptidase A4 family
VKAVAAFLLLWVTLGHASAGHAAGRMRSVHRPAITSISASRSTIPASGGRVVIRVTAAFSATCVFSGVNDPLQRSCSRGSASETVDFEANRASVRRLWTISVTSRGAGGTSLRRRITVTQRAATPVVVKPPPAATPASPAAAASLPPTAALSISASSVPSTGGTLTLSYSSSSAATCTLASTPAFWAGADPATESCNGSYHASVPAATTAGQWTFTFVATSGGGQTATSSQVLVQPAPAAFQNLIWSRYVVPSSTLLTHVSGAWIVPTLNCSDTPNAGASTWVGIGGYGWPTGGTSGALLQTGIADQCVNGAQTDFAWFELYPSVPNGSKSYRSFPVSPGDSIAAAVFQATSGAWETKVDDLTTGLSGIMVTGAGWGVAPDANSAQPFPEQGTTSGLTYTGGYTAEWIVEDFAVGSASSLVPLANYGTVTFSSLQTSLTSWSLTPGEAVAIAQNGAMFSTPSAPTADGFSVSYTGP